MGPFAQDRRVTTIGGGLNERFGRLEKSTPTTTKSATSTNIQTRTSTSVFSRIQGGNTSSSLLSAKRRQGTVSAIQSRIGRASGGSIQKRVGKAQSNISTRKQPSLAMGGNRGKQTKSKAAAAAAAAATAKHHRPKGNRKADLNGKQKKTKPSSSATEKGKKKPLSADDLDKALDSYMMKDPKTAQARLNDELDSYMDEAGDVLMDL